MKTVAAFLSMGELPSGGGGGRGRQRSTAVLGTVASQQDASCSRSGT